ncbi:MAG: GAF domain-containing protein [Anaerolineae bacterium]|nr:GAF domain-containing protein [Anaerolineae bacterium]
MIDPHDFFEELSRVFVELARVRDIDDVLVRLMDSFRELVSCSHTGIWLVGQEQGELQLRVTNMSGIQVTQTRLAFGEGIVGTVADTRRAMMVADSKRELQDEAFARNTFCSAIGVPMVWGEVLIGVLVAANDMPGRAFTAQDVRLAELIAQQAALLIFNIRATDECETSKRAIEAEQERLLHIQVAVRQLLEETDLQANLKEITEALQALGWRRVVLTLDAGGSVGQQKLLVGMSAEEEKTLQHHVIPEAVWQQCLNNELENARISGLYYVRAGDINDPAWHVDDLLFAPLRLGYANIVGVIRVMEPVDGQRPDIHALRALDILISQAAYVIENARLLEEASTSAGTLSGQVEELSMIHRADRELSENLNVDRVIKLTMDWALRRTGADAALLALMTEDSCGLVPFITMGYIRQEISECTEGNPWSLKQGLMGEAASTGETRVQHGQVDQKERECFITDAAAQISVPLSVRGEVLGVLSLASNNPDAFNDTDVSFLERLARRSAVALDNARLFRQSEQLADDMAVLYSASRAITATLERDTVLQRIAQSLALALECTSVIIFDCHRDEQAMQVAAVYKVATITDAHETLPEVNTTMETDSLPYVVHAFDLRQPVVVRAVDPELSDTDRQYLNKNGIHAMVLAPLVAQDELLGIAAIIEGRHDRLFNSNELFRAQTLASQASVALRQSLLYSDVLELERVKSEMIRMASHDLRNPLNNIIGYIELIKMSMAQFGMTPDQETYFTSLQRSANMMQTLIDDLLTLERAESQRESEWQVFDLGGLVYEVVEAERGGSSLKKQNLLLDRQENVPNVYGSVTQLRQAIANYVGNAIKYTPKGGQIDVKFYHEGGRLVLTVKDTGYGISPDRQVRIFERFYRAREPGTDHISGTGLGLSLVKTVIERHGGLVWFTSEKDAGSLFGMWLPAADQKMGRHIHSEHSPK